MLKHKRYQETVMDRILDYQKKVEQLIIDIENAELTKLVLEQLDVGNKAMKELNAVCWFMCESVRGLRLTRPKMRNG